MLVFLTSNNQGLAGIKIEEVDEHYVISDIIVSGDAANRDEAMENGVQLAKYIALDYMKRSIEDKQHIVINEVILNAIATSFTLKEFDFNDNRYTGQFDISFDKNQIKSVISDYKMSNMKHSKDKFALRIIVNGSLNFFTRVRNHLDRFNIDYSIETISYSYVDILFVDMDIYSLNKRFRKDGFSILYKDGMYIVERLW